MIAHGRAVHRESSNVLSSLPLLSPLFLGSPPRACRPLQSAAEGAERGIAEDPVEGTHARSRENTYARSVEARRGGGGLSPGSG